MKALSFRASDAEPVWAGEPVGAGAPVWAGAPFVGGLWTPGFVPQVRREAESWVWAWSALSGAAPSSIASPPAAATKVRVNIMSTPPLRAQSQLSAARAPGM